MLTAGAAQENHPVFSRVVNLASLISYSSGVTVLFMLMFGWMVSPVRCYFKNETEIEINLESIYSLDKKLSDSGKAVGVCGVE